MYYFWTWHNHVYTKTQAWHTYLHIDTPPQAQIWHLGFDNWHFWPFQFSALQLRLWPFGLSALIAPSPWLPSFDCVGLSASVMALALKQGASRCQSLSIFENCHNLSKPIACYEKRELDHNRVKCGIGIKQIQRENRNGSTQGINMENPKLGKKPGVPIDTKQIHYERKDTRWTHRHWPRVRTLNQQALTIGTLSVSLSLTHTSFVLLQRQWPRTSHTQLHW